MCHAKIEMVHSSGFARSNRIRNEKRARLLQLNHPRLVGNPEAISSRSFTSSVAFPRWTESIVYSFTGGQGGKGPFSGVIFDNLGNLYGTNESGGAYGFGTVYQLTPSGSGWTENTLHSFSGGNDGAHPWGGLLFDNSGNFYGTSSGGEGGYGTVFQLTHSNGNWTYTVIHNFTGSDGQGPVDNLIMDANGSLYGTVLDGGAHGYGSVFKLTPSEGSWTCISLHDFDGGDGGSPFGSLGLDRSGSLYGTTYSGGSYGLGIVFEITQ